MNLINSVSQKLLVYDFLVILKIIFWYYKLRSGVEKKK